MRKKGFLEALITWPAFPALVLMIFFLLFNNVFAPGYLTPMFLATFLKNNAPTIIVGLGLSMVLIGGGMDISTGSILCLINVVYVTMAGKGVGGAGCIIIGLLVGVVCGLINAICVSVFRVTPLLTTFATSSIFGGIALWIMPEPTGSIPASLVVWAITFLKGFGAPILFIAIAVVIVILVRRTKMGTYVYAVGQDEQKSYLSGVPVQKTKFFMYVFCGLMCGIGGVMQTTYIGSGDASIANSLTMNVIAACVIGGILLVGGIGDPIGAIFGAIFLGLIITTVLSSVKNSFFHNFATGVIQLAGVVGSILIARAIRNIRWDKKKLTETGKAGEING